MKPWRCLTARLLIAPVALAIGGAAPPLSPQDLNDHLLAMHNVERARLGVPPLRWSEKLARQSLRWARQLVSINQGKNADAPPDLEHSDTADYEDPAEADEGENLWAGTRGAFTPEQMVNNWIDERRLFVNGPFPNNSTTGQWRDVGHYTQVVWRSTTEVGCAVASGETFDFLVCRYLEGGNVLNEKPY